MATAVFFDRGLFSTALAAHEIGHKYKFINHKYLFVSFGEIECIDFNVKIFILQSLGAPHDHDIPGCNSTGYIMVTKAGYTGNYFSSCSDRAIEAYVSSDLAACLRSLQEPNGPVISQDYKVRPLKIDE